MYDMIMYVCVYMYVCMYVHTYVRMYVYNACYGMLQYVLAWHGIACMYICVHAHSSNIVESNIKWLFKS